MRPLKFLRMENGVAATELALLMPVLYLLVAGILDFGQLVYNDIQVAAAARTGAQYGADYALQNGYAAAGTDTAVTAGLATAMPSATPSKIAGQSDYLYCICVPTGGTGLGAATSCAATCAGGQSLMTYVGLTVSKTDKIPLALPYFGATATVTGQAVMRVK